MRKLVLLLVVVLIAFGIAACGGNNFIDDGNGHKQYKDSSGNFVKNDWVEIKGKKYFFDLNGYLVTNQWVWDEYYVDDEGVMQKEYWYTDKSGNMYFLDENGRYIRNISVSASDWGEIYEKPKGVDTDEKYLSFDQSGVMHIVKHTWSRHNYFNEFDEVTSDTFMGNFPPFDGKFSNSVATNSPCKCLLQVGEIDDKYSWLGYVYLTIIEYDDKVVKGDHDYEVTLKTDDGEEIVFEGGSSNYGRGSQISFSSDMNYRLPSDIMFNYLMNGKDFKLLLREKEVRRVPSIYLFEIEASDFRNNYFRE